MRTSCPSTLATVLVCASAGLAPSRAQTPELRGVWIARDGLSSRQKIIDTLDQLAAAKLNLVCVNVWSRGFTIHPSDVLFAACGQRQDPSYVGRDPLQEMIVEAHRRGLEVEAWFEYGFMLGWSGWFGGTNGVGPVLSANPSWIALDANGQSAVSDGGGGFFTWGAHENPAVRRFLLELCVEVAERYDVDGIQLDRVRYPSTSFGYDAATRAAYQAATGQQPPTNANQSSWKRWRADRLNQFHREVYDEVKLRRSTLRVTDAPTVMPGAYDNFLQDWPQWVSSGSLDLVYPQVYRTTLSSYLTTLDQQLSYVSTPLRSKVAPGIRAITGTATNDVLGMVAANRTRHLPGHVFWYAEGLYDDLPALQAQLFQNPAALPQRAAGWRPAPIQAEESDPTTLRSPAFALQTSAAASAGTFALASPSAAPSEATTFTLVAPEAGLYRVQIHVPNEPSLSTGAPHEIEHAGGVLRVLVDQRNTALAGWRELGTFWIDPALGPCLVRVGAVTLNQVSADAACLLRSRFASGAIQRSGSGTNGSNGVAALSLSGVSAPGGSLRVQLNRLPPFAPSFYVIGFAPSFLPLFGGALLVQPDLSIGTAANIFGSTELALPIPFQFGLSGLPIYVQGLALDAGAVGGAVLTPAATTTLP
ncbi:MAG: family 10 glycosylhydrolase [Planctomycetes bacterium]|nr:family 10 glycosylhydrolase [Planctomycetota bacterium]